MADSIQAPSTDMTDHTTERQARTHVAKPPFEDFLKALTALVDPQSKSDAVPKIAAALKKGFLEEVNPKHVEKVLAVLLPFRSLDRLAVRLASERPPRSRQIVVALLNRLRVIFANELGFPDNATRDGDRLFDLTEWIKVGEKSQLPSSPRHPDEWVRKAFLCLCTENDSDPVIATSAIHRLLCVIACRAKPEKGALFQPDRGSYLRVVGQLLSLKKITPQRVASSLQLCHPREVLMAQNERHVAECRQEATHAIQRAQELDKCNSRLNQDLIALRERETRLERQITETQSELQKEIDRSKELLDHSERELAQGLASQRHTLAATFMHDLQEARLCLDRSAPNVEMAMNRIRQMEEVVRKMEQAV